MDNLERLKDLKKDKRQCLYDYYTTKGIVVSFALLSSVILGRIISILTGMDPYSYVSKRNEYVTEIYDSTGETETYHTLEVINALDEIEVNVYTAWIQENEYYIRHKDTYSLEYSDELRDKLLNNLNNITEEDLKDIQFKKRKGFYQYTEKLDEESYKKGPYITMTTTYLGEKVKYIQSFEENLFEIGLDIFITFMLFRLIKDLLTPSSKEYLEQIVEDYNCIEFEIDKIKKEEKVRKLVH